MMPCRAINYTRVFTEMGEALVETVVKTPNEVRLVCTNFLMLVDSDSNPSLYQNSVTRFH